MAAPRKRKPNSQTYSGTVPPATVSTPMPSVSTPAVTSPPSSATPYVPTADTTSSTPGCPTAFVCGQQNYELKQRIAELEERLSQVEETAAEKRSFLKKAESLLLVFKIVLIAMPIVLFVALATVQYFVYNDSKLLNWVTGIIGIATVLECFLLSILWKSIDSRLEKVEEQLKD